VRSLPLLREANGWKGRPFPPSFSLLLENQPALHAIIYPP